MKKTNPFEEFGAPDIELGALKIWVHGRQYPEVTDYWDGNWVRVTVYCSSHNSYVITSGPIVHLSEIAHLLRIAEEINEGVAKNAELELMEQDLSFHFESRATGRVNVEAHITPSLEEAHRYSLDLDQSYLTLLARGCRTVLKRFPVVGAEH